MAISINDRLTKAISFIDNCGTLADIGSDHGYSSIYAIQKGIAKKVIATDISKPSLAKTEKLVNEYDLSQCIECRAGDGMKVLASGEVDAALIAGMGAELIAQIIRDSHQIASAIPQLILQPMNSAQPLRRALSEMGYGITHEGIVVDNDKFYQIIKCSYGNPKPLSDDEAELGTFVYNERIPLCKEYVEHIIRKQEKIMEYVGNNDEDKLRETAGKIERYRRVLEWINAR